MRTSAWRQVRRGLRWGARRAWTDARPGAGADLRSRAASPVDLERAPPAPDEVFVPRTEPTGPWASIDPLVAPPWPRRIGALASVVVWTGVALRARAGWRATSQGDLDPS